MMTLNNNESEKGKPELIQNGNIPEGQQKKLKKTKRCRKRLSQLLHTHVVLITVCVLSALDAGCVLGQIICDILIMSEKLHDSDMLKESTVAVLMKVCPEANYTTADGHSPTLEQAIESVKKHSCYSSNSSNFQSQENQHRFTYYTDDTRRQGEIHHRSKRASGSGDHAHAEHTLVETLTHAFHLGSLVILSLLVFETFLKIFAMGSHFLNHRLEVFDAFVVTVSWILDLSFYEGIWAQPGSEAATILIIILPWRVIRIVNSFVLVIKEKDLVILKVIKQQYRRLVKREKELTNKLEQYRIELRQLQGLCRKHGAKEPEIAACAPIGRRRTSSIMSGMSSFASLAMIGAVGSQPDLARESSSDEDDDIPSPTPSQIKEANHLLRSVSTTSSFLDGGMSDTVTFSLSPDPTSPNGQSNPVFTFEVEAPSKNSTTKGDSTKL
ncbi:uncharacterized protein LOC133199608 isoform X2 [Saccostrea echinata]|uniref:uncharacterized protein LOC133199608 isoform X2 n=1 Tax=Saccostrea echinata TaxID=191078 RepID=UPI002A830717|nr:uncharacterized protein LOC133199608 isoform X2 [Saccostrea echinata]